MHPAANVGVGAAWAAFDAARKALAPRMSASAVVIVCTIGQLPFLAGWVIAEAGRDALFVDIGAYALPGSLALAGNVAANLMFIVAMRVSPLGVTIPMLSFTPVFTALPAWLFLGEALGAAQLLGVLVVVLGALLLNLRAEDIARPRQYLATLARERGSLLMLGVALLFSVLPVIDKEAVGGGAISMSAHVLVQVAGIGIALLIGLAVRGRLAELAPIGRSPWLCAATGGIGALAVGAQLAVLLQTEVSRMEGVKRAVEFGLTTALLGPLLFGERVRRLQLIAVALMTVSVVLLVQ